MSGRSFGQITCPSADFSPSGVPEYTLPTAADAHRVYESGLKEMQPVPADRPEGINFSPYAHEEAALQRIHSEGGLNLGMFNRDAITVCRPTLPEPPDVYQQEVQARMAETTRVFEQ